MKSKKHMSGFSLLELALVMVVIGVLLSIFVFMFPQFTDQVRRDRTINIIIPEIQNALLAFARYGNRLPCPSDTVLTSANAGFGIEDCNLSTGSVPHITLGMEEQARDAHQRPIRYSVYRNSADSSDLAAPGPTNHFDGLDEIQGLYDRADFCLSLENASPDGPATLTSTSTSASTGGCSIAGQFTNQAYVLSSSGSLDTDDNGDFFDTDNDDALPLCHAWPQRIHDTDYDDIVVAAAFTYFSGHLCSARPIVTGPSP